MHTQSVNGLSQPLYSLAVYQRSRRLAFLCLKVDKRSDTILWWMVKASGMSVHAGLDINKYTTVLHTRMHTHACTQTHTHTHTQTYTHTHAQTYTHTHAQTYTHTHMHTTPTPHMNTHAHTHVHACTHTHIHPSTPTHHNTHTLIPGP